MLKINMLTKDYGKGAGNFDISLKIKSGEVFGIMGPNGAGKSTLIRQILGFVKPDSGTVIVDGIDPFVGSKNIMLICGYIPGELSLYDSLLGITYLKIVAKLKGNIDWNFVEKLVEFFCTWYL